MDRPSRPLRARLAIATALLAIISAATAPAVVGQTSNASTGSDSTGSDSTGSDSTGSDSTVLATSVRSGERAADEIRGRVAARARERLAAAEAGDADALARLQSADDELIQTAAAVQLAGAELDALQVEQRELTDDHRQARDERDLNLATLYAHGPIRTGDSVIEGYDPVAERTRELLIEAVLAQDEDELLAAFAASNAAVDLSADAAERRAAEEVLKVLREQQKLASTTAEAAADELARLAALPDDVVFPIASDYQFVDTFLAPRWTGSTPRRHQGTDVFAPRGTPLLAMERGLLVRIGEISLGGKRLWLIGESGTQYYYAHLDDFADVTEGQFVEAGTVVGYVGTTGNAQATPPHLHIQVHPDGGVAVNPYPLLRQLAERDAERAADGLAPVGQ